MAKQPIDTFLLRKDFFPQIKLLTREQRGDLLTAIYAYASDEALPEMDAVTQICFGFIRTSMDANTSRYRERCERNRENGSRGGRPTRMEETERLFEKPNGYFENQTVSEKTDGVTEKPNGYFENPVDIDNDGDIDFDISSSSPSPARACESDDEGAKTPSDASNSKTPEKGCAEKGPPSYPAGTYLPIKEVAGYLKGHAVWLEAFCMNNHLDPEFVKCKIDEFARDLQDSGETAKEKRDCVRHFKNWLRKNREKHEQRQSTTFRVGVTADDGREKREQNLRDRVAARLARAEARKMGP